MPGARAPQAAWRLDGGLPGRCLSRHRRGVRRIPVRAAAHRGISDESSAYRAAERSLRASAWRRTRAGLAGIVRRGRMLGCDKLSHHSPLVQPFRPVPTPATAKRPHIVHSAACRRVGSRRMPSRRRRRSVSALVADKSRNDRATQCAAIRSLAESASGGAKRGWARRISGMKGRGRWIDSGGLTGAWCGMGRSGAGVSDAFRQQRVYCRLAFSPVP